MSQSDEINRALRERGLDPTITFIVRKRITYVSSEDLRTLEIWQFMSSTLTLIAGVFLGVITNPQVGYPFYVTYMILGISLLIGGMLVFIMGVHFQIRKWEKEREPFSVVK